MSITAADLPDLKFTKAGSPRETQPLTIPNVEKVLEATNTTVRMNVMTGAPDFTAGGVDIPPDRSGYAIEAIIDNLQRVDIGAAVARVNSILAEIAQENKYHPMEDWLNTLKWDGVSRIPALADTVTTGNDLWPVYLRKWLIQVVEGVCGWRETQERSLPHVLVLVGGQGVGKSHWLAALGGAWFKGEAELHLSTPSGKDHQIAVLRFPMAELAELDGIFRKADVATMKAFISRGVDEVRAPYERRALVRPRMTSFCGSVNEAEFLNDTSGSRRFWPVSVDAIDWDFEMDWAQLWAEAFELWVGGASYNLTAEEDEQRASTAIKAHTLLSSEAEKIGEFYRRHHGHKAFPDTPMNRTEILEMLYGRRNFYPKIVADTGRILADMIGKSKTIDGKQRAWMFPYNEFAQDVNTWPDKNHLEIVS